MIVKPKLAQSSLLAPLVLASPNIIGVTQRRGSKFLLDPSRNYDGLNTAMKSHGLSSVSMPMRENGKLHL